MKKLLVILTMLFAINANAQWVQTNGPYNGGINCFAVSETKIFVGTTNYAGSCVHFSTNNGNNWLSTGLTNKTVKTLCVNDSNIFAGTYGNGLFLSSNNGINWIAVNNGLTALYIFAMIRVGTNIFAGTNGGIYRTTNNGNNWTAVNNGIPTWSIGARALAQYGNNIYAGTLSGVYLSTNNGSYWNYISDGLPPQNITLLCVSGSNIFAGTYEGLFLTTNNGTNWTAITSGLNQTILCATLYEPSLLIGTNEGVFSSTNNGTNWFQKNQGFTEILQVPALVVNNNYIFAGVQNQYVYRRPFSEITGIQNISTETPSKYSLSQNYPNPFNSMCNVQFSIARHGGSSTGDVKLVVYDIMGKEVQTLVNERLQPGTYEAAFDGTMLNSGVYFYKLVTEGYSETKKMLMIK